MNLKSIQLVQDSFQKVIPMADQAMIIFYEKLFEINPSLKSLFPEDSFSMGEQRNKLRNMLSAAIKGLNEPEKLLPALKNLGKRHLNYGVKDEHYQDVGAALLATLEVGIGDDFTPEVKQAWTDIYGIMSMTMIRGDQGQEEEE